jgi:hypothetical protein
MVRANFSLNPSYRYPVLRRAAILLVALLLGSCGKGGEIHSLSPGEYVGADSYGNGVDIVFQVIGSDIKITKLSITLESDRKNPVTVEAGQHLRNAFGINEGGNIEFVLLLLAPSNSIMLSGHVEESVGLWGLLFGTPQEELVLSLEKPNKEVSGFKENLGSGEIGDEVLKHLRDKYEFVLTSKH